MDFDLDKFLKNYKEPKKLDFSLYLKLDKLKGYEKLINNVDDLETFRMGHTYVKYIKDSDAFSNEEYKTHVHCGGIFLSGGTYCDGEYVKLINCRQWTHISLKRQPHSANKGSSKKGLKTKHEAHIFKIRLGGNYVFYKHFE